MSFPSPRAGWVARLALITYASLLSASLLAPAGRAGVAGAGLFDLRTGARIRTVALAVAAYALVEVLRFVPVGILAVLSVPRALGDGLEGCPWPRWRAMEKAIVSTRIGAEGLPIRHGDELLLADDPPSFAAAVVRLLQDHAMAQRLGKAAAARVRQDFGWAAVSQHFTALCERVAQADVA